MERTVMMTCLDCGAEWHKDCIFDTHEQVITHFYSLCDKCIKRIGK